MKIERKENSVGFRLDDGFGIYFWSEWFHTAYAYIGVKESVSVSPIDTDVTVIPKDKHYESPAISDDPMFLVKFTLDE